MQHGNLMVLCFVEAELWPFAFLHFSSFDLELDPMTFIYELDQYSLEIYRMCEDELPTSSLRTLSYYSLRVRAFSYTWSLPVM